MEPVLSNDIEEVFNTKELNEDIGKSGIEVGSESARIDYDNMEHIDQNIDGLKFCEGMIFTSLEKAEELYKAFAKANGFTVRIRNTRPGRRGSISSREFVCSCQGFCVEKKQKEVSVAKEQDRRTLTRRCGCEAMLVVKWDKKKNIWMAHKFSNDHNHNMVSPKSKCYLIPNKCMPIVAKNLVEKFNEISLPIGKVPTVLGNMDGINFNERDCYNHMRDKRRKDLVIGDAQSVVEYCRRKQTENPNFFYAIDCDKEGRMINFFWVEARGRLYYEKFEDVVVFDTTYRTNKYEMPFANFVGVNNHLQSIFFGCALLQDEQEESFVWLFTTWLEAMHGKAPKSILTDQDQSIGNAVKRVFAGTTHRLCLWHITNKFPSKIGMCKSTSGFHKEMSNCIRDSISPEVFEKDWKIIIERYKLEGNTWLNGLYEIRHSWIPVYNRTIFFAGMNTTQRSESMHSFFDSFVNNGTTLREFVIKYEKALECRYLDEQDEQYVSKYKFTTKAKSPLELHGATVYTRNVFNLFQDELTVGIYMRTIEIGMDGTYTIYEVSCFKKPERKCLVYINLDSLNGWCECHLFEFKGILCRHILGVLHKRDVEEIPAHFILPRWTTKVIYDMDISVQRNCDELPLVLRNMIFYRMVNHLSSYLDTSEKTYQLIVNSIEETYNKVVAMEGPISMKKIEEPREQELNDHTPLQDPVISRTKGRPKDSVKVSQKGRIMSGVEVSMKRRRKCSNCNVLGHDIRTCDQLNEEC
ncbi:Protein FAR1-RELATED SEQUENCE 5 [Rhynchospora pubera]|uniref:Protein FAR1-RELATED SEQUENCE n=1 Tax=Rhynchospora pubera TaxID=906938 RepID=A0AAV8GZS1_9POAL|nr:Protein FAR1-RELATED SEQUENCE 5 [Rhynchospora pubera]